VSVDRSARWHSRQPPRQRCGTTTNRGSSAGWEAFQSSLRGRVVKQRIGLMGVEGWTTKRRLSKRSGKSVGGGKWTGRRVLDVLNNPVCLGVFADNDKVRPGCHPAIIDVNPFADTTILRVTSVAGHSRVYSSTIVSTLTGRPSAVWSFMKSHDHTWSGRSARLRFTPFALHPSLLRLIVRRGAFSPCSRHRRCTRPTLVRNPSPRSSAWTRRYSTSW